jgi:hypothetical protein
MVEGKFMPLDLGIWFEKEVLIKGIEYLAESSKLQAD